MAKHPVELESLSTEEFKKIFDSFDYIFSDCDGVIWSETSFPRTGEFVKIAKQLGKTVHFVSNNSSNSREKYKTLFVASHIENGIDHLTLPSIAISEYLTSHNFNKHVYCVACTETVHILESYGLKCKTGPDVGPDYFADYVKYLEDDPEIGAVVFDSDFQINLPKLYKSITYLKRPDVLFLSGASDKVTPLKKECLVLGTGVFTEMVEEQTHRKSVLLGKPGKLFGEFAMKRAGATDPSRVLFIGDMLAQDMGLGKAVGFKTMLVLSNSTKEDMLAAGSLMPDYYANGLANVVTQLEKLL